MSNVHIVYVTFPSEEVAKEIVRQLLAEKLIACGNLFPISSLYSWEGQMQEEKEIAAHLKTTNTLIPGIRARLIELHPYEVPCIVDWAMDGNERYVSWVEKSVR
ncbi:MAG: divalent-cation tolerance protein CutA [Saprospiraceae bacterium]|nr:divalent-cation tolerance protein CutA [Saprospiraceae bacterium]